MTSAPFWSPFCRELQQYPYCYGTVCSSKLQHGANWVIRHSLASTHRSAWTLLLNFILAISYELSSRELIKPPNDVVSPLPVSGALTTVRITGVLFRMGHWGNVLSSECQRSHSSELQPGSLRSLWIKELTLLPSTVCLSWQALYTDWKHSEQR